MRPLEEFPLNPIPSLFLSQEQRPEEMKDRIFLPAFTTSLGQQSPGQLKIVLPLPNFSSMAEQKPVRDANTLMQQCLPPTTQVSLSTTPTSRAELSGITQYLPKLPSYISAFSGLPGTPLSFSPQMRVGMASGMGSGLHFNPKAGNGLDFSTMYMRAMSGEVQFAPESQLSRSPLSFSPANNFQRNYSG